MGEKKKNFPCSALGRGDNVVWLAVRNAYKMSRYIYRINLPRYLHCVCVCVLREKLFA